MLKNWLCLIFCIFLFSSSSAAKLSDFKDTDTIPSWSKLSFDVLLTSNIISGNNEGFLKPNDTINRAEFLKILLKATKQDLVTPLSPSFPDVMPEHWFYAYIETAKSLGWIDGYPDGTFRPGNPINRAEMAKLINQAFKIERPNAETNQPWYQREVNALATFNLLPFNTTSTNFGAERTPIRAEAFEQMYRAMKYNFTKTAAPDNPHTVTEGDGHQYSYEVPANFGLIMTITPDGGRLDLKRPDNQPESLDIKAGQKNVTALQLEMVARDGAVTLNNFQFQRIGTGRINDFSQVWLESDNRIISPKKAPLTNTDLVTFNLSSPLTIPQNQIVVLNLKVDMSAQAQIGATQRFVLSLPDWLNANTNEKIGLFPIGGPSLEIQAP